MKKIFRGFAAVLVGCSIFGLIGYAGELDNTYELKAEVTQYKYNELNFTDDAGMKWVLDIDNLNINVGDEIEVRFFTNFTPHRRTDDTIRWIKVNNKKINRGKN